MLEGDTCDREKKKHIRVSWTGIVGREWAAIQIVVRVVI